MKDSEFCVFYSCPEEISNGIGAGMERDCVEKRNSLIVTLRCVLHHLCCGNGYGVRPLFVGFINKDEGVMFRISHIVLYPIPAGVVTATKCAVTSQLIG